MNLKTAKTPKDINLTGIIAEYDVVDGQVVAVILKDTAGGLLTLRQGQYSGLAVLVPAPPKLVGRWRVRGTVGTLVVEETFTDEYSAKSRIAELGLGPDVKPEKVIVEE
jgi:hypothetical protein